MKDRKVETLSGQRGIIKSLLSRFDFFPVVVSERKLSVRSKMFHTFIGLFLMVSYQLCPFFLIHFLERGIIGSTTFLSTNSKNMTTIARNALLVGPVLYALMNRMFDFKTNTKAETQKYSRALRNLSVIVSSFIRNVGLLYYLQMDVEAIVLIPKTSYWISFLLITYGLSSLFTSMCAITIEQYITSMGLFGQNVMLYYQLTDLFLNVFSSPIPVLVNWYSVVKLILLIYGLVLIDRLTRKKLTIVHSQVYSLKRTINYNLSSKISLVICVQNILKGALYNFFNLFINPLWSLMYKRVLIADYWLQSPYFKNNYYLIWFFPIRSAQFVNLMMWNLFENLIIFSLITWFIQWFSLEQDPQFLHQHLIDSRYKVYGSRSLNDQLTIIKQHQRTLKIRVLIIGSLTQLCLPLVCFYGVILRGDLIYYYYGKLNSILQMLLQVKPDQIPLVLRPLRDNLLKCN